MRVSEELYKWGIYKRHIIIDESYQKSLFVDCVEAKSAREERF